MGTARGVADALVPLLAQAGYQARINAMPSCTDILQDAQEILLLCTSNTGMGDLPANIAPLYTQLTQPTGKRPSLERRRYGAIILGDSLYPNFAEAGHKLDKAFADRGATRIGRPLVLDARLNQDHIATATGWASDWVTKI